jgi:HK97 gp10 family phage protein
MGVDVNNGSLKIQGFDDLARKLRSLPDAMRKKVVRNALAAGGRLVRDAARRAAPVLQQPSPYRTAGLLRRSLVVRTSKRDRLMGNVGVFINVRPAKGARFKTTTRKVFGVKIKTRRQTRASQRGAKSRLDPFYWRFVEFGTRQMPARKFLQGSAAQLPAALNIFKTQVGRWIDKTNRTGKVTP